MPSSPLLRLALPVVLLGALAGCAAPAPVADPDPGIETRAPTAPTEDTAAAPEDLTGTEWEGVDSDGDRLYLRFDADGALYYENPAHSDDTPGNDFWSRDGDAVRLDINDDFVVYQGELSGSTLAGTASNADRQWIWSVDLLG